MSLEDAVQDDVYAERPSVEIEEQTYTAEGQVTARTQSIQDLQKLQKIVESQVGVSHIDVIIDFSEEIDALHRDIASDIAWGDLNARADEIRELFEKHNIDGEIVSHDDRYWVNLKD